MSILSIAARRMSDQWTSGGGNIDTGKNGAQNKSVYNKTGVYRNNNLCMKLDRTASLVERGQEASGAYEILGLQAQPHLIATAVYMRMQYGNIQCVEWGSRSSMVVSTA